MQKCRVCEHPEVSRINELLAEGTTPLTIHRTYGLSRPSVMRHRDAHLAKRTKHRGKSAPKEARKPAPKRGSKALPPAAEPTSPAARKPDEIIPPTDPDAPPAENAETFREPEDVLRRLESLLAQSQQNLDLAKENPLLYATIQKEHRATLNDIRVILREVDRSEEDADLLRH